MNYFDQIKKKYPDLNSKKEKAKAWERKGFIALKDGNLEIARSCFEKLSVACPRRHTGFEGLAYVYFLSNRMKRAEWFMMKAVSTAEHAMVSKSLDEDIVKVLHHNLKAVRDDGKLYRWWEKVDWDKGRKN